MFYSRHMQNLDQPDVRMKGIISAIYLLTKNQVVTYTIVLVGFAVVDIKFRHDILNI